ncbi:hypothetical protein D9757_001207 [Collybiopsis confluens]|uniref:GPI inositol-deacylase n=1 Tax=Collybiopsis confluens TaxID=2823264 RepID=A0A8H5I1B8_9AGAR|nr:hypothetical protein D9757_001207 [Collybiopsis confluens]
MNVSPYTLASCQDVAEHLSPQGCRMSYMNPSYIPQTRFNTSWTPLAERYSLLLYREDQWERELHGATPVLFIPGNAGSSGQVRSIASSATRQYYIRPNEPAYEVYSRNMKPLDFFAVDFNEDLSAFHGPTLQSQTEYCARAVSYILSLYPADTTIIIMGHSMGGVVATSLLPSKDIAAIITMSTPHTLPPARFDQRVNEIYERNREALFRDPTPILSLCGGATDMMIPSELCILPWSVEGLPYRRTVFSSALEGSWTGVGHREMVWCHQVRWRVARAAMELTMATSSADRGVVLDRWLRDGHTLPPPPTEQTPETFTLNEGDFEMLRPARRLFLRDPRWKSTHILPVLADSPRFVLFVSQGSISPIAPQKPYVLLVSVSICLGSSAPFQCGPLQPIVHRLIPNPVPGTVFPAPQQGVDESEGVVVFEADLTLQSLSGDQWVAVRIEQSDGEGWVVGGFVSAEKIISNVSMLGILFGGTFVSLRESHQVDLRTSIRLPKLSSNALVVYRVTPSTTEDTFCEDSPPLWPLLVHSSHPSETHYYTLSNYFTSVSSQGVTSNILLHTHGSAPYIESVAGLFSEGVEVVIYSAFGACPRQLLGFHVAIDWTATLGRWPARYLTTIVCWAIGIVSLIVFEAWGSGESDHTPSVPPVTRSLREFGQRRLPRLLLASLLIALLPLSEQFFLGNGGNWIYAPMAPLLLLIASGLVCASWGLLLLLMWPVGKIGNIFSARQQKQQEEITGARRSTLVSMAFVFALIFFFIPWQVAYLCCWFIHMQSCAADWFASSEEAVSIAPVTAIPLLNRDESSTPIEDTRDIPRMPSAPPSAHRYLKSNRNHKAHLLLFMTWLLPLAAPVLVVWVRTLVTAGLTTPFDGDHFFLNVAPFLILVDFASWTSRPLLLRKSGEWYFSTRWSLCLVAAIAFFDGPRRTYHIFDAARLAIGALAAVRIGPQYWGRSFWRF